jgi:excinuclease ABC subunit C
MGLPKVPQRIEGYDISNIFGKDAVGSMAVFSGGEPDKNEYRKFKIRADSASAKATAEKHGDVQMLKEVLERRFKRSAMPEPQNKGTISPHEIITKSDSIASLQNDRWALPDLLIIDGGKGQLNAALTVLKKFISS